MWHYTSDRGRHGPVSEEEIAQRIAAGEISPTTFVRHETSLDWVEAYNTELARYFPKGAGPGARHRDWEDRGPSWLSRLVSFIFVAVMLGAGVWIAAGGPGKMAEGTSAEALLPDGMLTDESLARRLQARFEKSPEFSRLRWYGRMKALFPADYHGLWLSIAPGYRMHSSLSIRRAQEIYLRNFLQTQKAFMQHASPAALGSLLAAHTGLFRNLEQRDLALCGVIAVGAEHDVDIQDRLMITSWREADDMNVAMLEAIASGRGSTVTYQPLTDLDYYRLMPALSRAGFDPQRLVAFSKNLAEVSPEDRCHFLTAINVAMNQNPDANLRARYGAELARRA